MVTSTVIEPMLKKAVASGSFGEGAELINFENSNKKGEDHFASEVLFLTLKIKVNGEVQEVPVVMKLQPSAQVVREKANTKAQFKNEILMYSEILPFLERNGVVAETFPKYYGGFAADGEEHKDDFVLLEDLSKDGYRLTAEKVFLDYDHCFLVVKQIAKFHALSYAVKHDNDLSKILSFSSKIMRKHTTQMLEDRSEFFYLCGKRGVNALLNEGKDQKFLEGFLRNYENFPKFYFSLIDPVEPEAVFCHGDFCRNNMFFKYGPDGRPVSVKFFDLQAPNYTSPGIDLSFFLLMNTSQMLRDKHWDNFISLYKESVRNSISTNVVPELDFCRVAVYGYLHCSFFLPTMMGKPKTVDDLEEMFRRTPHENAILASTYGGEEGTTVVADVVRHLYNRNYLQASYY